MSYNMIIYSVAGIVVAELERERIMRPTSAAQGGQKCASYSVHI